MNNYVSVVKDSLKIVDRFRGTEKDVQERSSALEHVIVPAHLNSQFIILTRNPNTSEIEFSLDEDAINAQAQKVIDTKWVVLREERDFLLKESDWVVSTPDAPFTQEKIEEWKTYRQALRDLPANTADPENPVWPEAPTP